MVDLRWPTCISLAIFGEEKSTITLLIGSRGAQESIPSVSIFCTLCRRNFFLLSTYFKQHIGRHATIQTLAYKFEDTQIEIQWITFDIHFFDKTILTNPGPATEHDSTISDGGRFFIMAYTNKQKNTFKLKTKSNSKNSN